jgi:hypothetical protein
VAPGPDRAGRQGPSAGSELLSDLLGDLGEVSLEVVLLLADREQRCVLLLPCLSQLGGAPLELHPRRRELLLARGDLVARRPDGVDGDLHLVPQLADAADDVVVLALERPHVLGPRHEVVEAVRLEQHRDQVRLIRLVDRDQALLEDPDRLAEALLQHVEPGLGPIELRLLLSQLRSRRGLPITQDRDLRGEPNELRGLVADPRREDAGVSPRMRELVLCDVELLLEALPRGPAHCDRAGAGDQGAAERQPKTFRSSHLPRRLNARLSSN